MRIFARRILYLGRYKGCDDGGDWKDISDSIQQQECEGQKLKMERTYTELDGILDRLCINASTAKMSMMNKLKPGRWYQIRTIREAGEESEDNCGRRLTSKQARLMSLSKNIAVFRYRTGITETFKYTELFFMELGGRFRKLTWDEVVMR